MRQPGSMPGKVLVVAEPQNFNAAYIRRSLEWLNVTVVTCEVMPGAVSPLQKADVSGVIGCLVIDLPPERLTDLGIGEWNVPILFVGRYMGFALPAACTWMQAPFASYQVIDTLFGLVPVKPADGGK